MVPAPVNPVSGASKKKGYASCSENLPIFSSPRRFVVATLLIADPAAAQSAFAEVNADCNIAAYGGSDTTTAFCNYLGPGVYEINFNGNFPGQTTPDKVVVNTTAESVQYGVSNAVVTFASFAAINVTVFTWVSDTLVTSDNAFFVTVFVGHS